MKMTDLERAEFESVRQWDEEVENTELTLEDYQQSKMIDDLLDPVGAKRRQKAKEAYQEWKEEAIKNGT